MQACCEAHLQEPALHLAKQKVLSSLHNHWEGLTVFVGRPEVAMDNNTAERILRNPVVGRKNYDGSGSVWSAHLAARMFSVVQTVLLWGLNPHHWLSAFLQACADNGGKCPTDLSAFLPWQMTPERREAFARPVPVTCAPLDRSRPRERRIGSSRHLLTPDPPGRLPKHSRHNDDAVLARSLPGMGYPKQYPI